jgi:ribA/ribD-fused uncharacterized protein
MITFNKSKDKNGWLGNMTGGFPIQWGGKEWRTAEALFQAFRFSGHPDGPEIQEEIRLERSPMAAKFVAKKHTDKMVVEPTSSLDLQNMENVVRAKLEQHPQLKKELLATKDEVIIEDVTNRGLTGRNGFWGMAKNKITGEWEGENHLGKIIMKIRDELK